MRRILRRARAEGGFTLIELLVVIAIIGILPSLLLPAVKVTPGCDEEPERVTVSGPLQATFVLADREQGTVRVTFTAQNVTGTGERGGSYRLVGSATTVIPGDSEQILSVQLRIVGVSGSGKPVNQPIQVTIRISVDPGSGEPAAEFLRALPLDPCDDDDDRVP